MPLPFVDLGAEDSEFASILKRETAGEGSKVTGRNGWIEVTRPFPDLAISVNTRKMAQIQGRGTQIGHTTSMDYLRRLWETGQPITYSNLEAGRIVSAEGFATLGLATILGSEFYENELLRSIPGARPGLRIVAYCPKALRESAAELVEAVHWIRRKTCFRAISRFVIHHELGHFFIDPELRLDDSRFHDAFASYLAFGALPDQDSKDAAQVLSVLHQTQDYNYYLLLNNYDGTKGILRKALEGDLHGAKVDFYSLIAPQPLVGTTNAKLRVMGDIVGWPGFGARNPLVVCSGEVVGVANLREGVVAAAKIRIVDGFFPESVRLFANEVGTISETANRSRVLRLVPRASLDIAELVKSTATIDEIVKACETGQMTSQSEVPLPRLMFNVCLPCNCDVFIITEEVTRDPDSVDVGKVRSARCDKCGLVVEHSGAGIAFLSIDSNRNPVWHSRGGSAALELRIRSTENWLQRTMPAGVISRLGR